MIKAQTEALIGVNTTKNKKKEGKGSRGKKGRMSEKEEDKKMLEVIMCVNA